MPVLQAQRVFAANLAGPSAATKLYESKKTFSHQAMVSVYTELAAAELAELGTAGKPFKNDALEDAN